MDSERPENIGPAEEGDPRPPAQVTPARHRAVRRKWGSDPLSKYAIIISAAALGFSGLQWGEQFLARKSNFFEFQYEHKPELTLSAPPFGFKLEGNRLSFEVGVKNTGRSTLRNLREKMVMFYNGNIVQEDERTSGLPLSQGLSGHWIGIAHTFDDLQRANIQSGRAEVYVNLYSMYNDDFSTHAYCSHMCFGYLPGKTTEVGFCNKYFAEPRAWPCSE
jgi:hypothetical protein